MNTNSSVVVLVIAREEATVSNDLPMRDVVFSRSNEMQSFGFSNHISRRMLGSELRALCLDVEGLRNHAIL